MMEICCVFTQKLKKPVINFLTVMSCQTYFIVLFIQFPINPKYMIIIANYSYLKCCIFYIHSAHVSLMRPVERACAVN